MINSTNINRPVGGLYNIHVYNIQSPPKQNWSAGTCLSAFLRKIGTRLIALGRRHFPVAGHMLACAFYKRSADLDLGPITGVKRLPGFGECQLSEGLQTLREPGSRALERRQNVTFQNRKHINVRNRPEDGVGEVYGVYDPLLQKTSEAAFANRGILPPCRQSVTIDDIEAAPVASKAQETNVRNERLAIPSVLIG